MAITKKAVFIIGAKRTPFCSFLGSLRDLPASYAFAAAAKDAIKTANLDPSFIDNTVVGNIHFLSQCDGGKTPRYCGTYSGVPLTSPALGVNKACGTGLQAVITGAMDIITGCSEISLTGGTEIMSALPMLVRDVRFGTALGKPYLLDDSVKKLNVDSYTGLTIQKMAEECAKKIGVIREEADAFALQSHLKWKAAQDSKVFDDEITKLTVILNKQEIDVTKDELPNPSITSQDLSQFPPLVVDGNIVTSGNCFVPADGAAAVLIASEESLTTHNLAPLAKVVGWSCVGVDPVNNGIAPVTAINNLLTQHNLKLDDIDLFEINEALAAQTVATVKLLKLDIHKVNVNGGAISMGHPISATGARMITHLVYELGRRNLKRGIAASSCGGGQGVAVLLEKV